MRNLLMYVLNSTWLVGATQAKMVGGKRLVARRPWRGFTRWAQIHTYTHARQVVKISEHINFGLLSYSCLWFLLQLKPAVQLRMGTSLCTVPQATNATSSTQGTLPLASRTGDSASNSVETLVANWHLQHTLIIPYCIKPHQLINKMMEDVGLCSGKINPTKEFTWTFDKSVFILT